MFIAIYMDYSDNAVGHTWLLGVYELASDAAKAVNADMVGFIRCMVKNGNGLDIDWSEREVWVEGEEGQNGYIWDILDSKCA